MRKIYAGECTSENVFHIVDPTTFLEIDFEAEVVKALSCLFPDYVCGVFSGAFLLEGERKVADLALVHKSFSHWFVIEVELAGHSFDQHVLPQVRCFRYGEPHSTCLTSLQRAFGFLSQDEAMRLLTYVPRYVAVVSNMPDCSWAASLRALDVQLLTVSIYRDKAGRVAREVEGELVARTESLGFARFSAIDNCLRITKGCGLPLGTIQILDQFGILAPWVIRESADVLWISKERGPALLDHDAYVQIIRTFDGRVSLRPSASGHVR